MNGDPTALRGPTALEPPEAGADGPLSVRTDLEDRALREDLGLFKGNLRAGVLETNDALGRLIGPIEAPNLGWDWLEVVHEDDRDRFRRALEAAGTSGSRSAFPARLHRLDGVVEQVRVVVAGITAPGMSGYFVGTIGQAAGRTMPRSDPAASGSETPATPSAGSRAAGCDGDDRDPYEVLLDTLPVAVGYLAPDGAVEFANTTWRAWTEAVAGHPLTTLDAISDDLDDWIAAGALTEPWSDVARIGKRSYDVVLTPVPVEAGGGAVVTMTDISDGPGDPQLLHRSPSPDREPASSGDAPAEVAQPLPGVADLGRESVDHDARDVAFAHARAFCAGRNLRF